MSLVVVVFFFWGGGGGERLERSQNSRVRVPITFFRSEEFPTTSFPWSTSFPGHFPL